MGGAVDGKLSGASSCGAGAEPGGGTRIEPTPDGPFVCVPEVAGGLRDAEGAPIEIRGDMLLCRRGVSRNRPLWPLCGDAHWFAGFVTLEGPLARHQAESGEES